MHTQTLKQQALESLRELPEDSGIDEMMYRLYVIDKLRNSQHAIAQGDSVDHDELKREIEQW